MDDETTKLDVYHILKCLTVKDRNMINQDFYSQINKILQDQSPELFGKSFKNADDLKNGKEDLYKDILKIRKDWDSLIKDKNYQIIYQGFNIESILIQSPHYQDHEYDRLNRIVDFQVKVA